MADEQKPNPAEVTPALTPTPQPVKTFTQDEVNGIVSERLARDRAKLYKQFGIEDESKLPEVVEKVKAHDVLKAENETFKTERAKGERLTALREIGIDDAFLDFALSKIESGKDLEAYKANAKAFAEANPKLRKETFQTIQSGLPLNGASAGLPDFTKMSDKDFLEWQKTHNLDGTLKTPRK